MSTNLARGMTAAIAAAAFYGSAPAVQAVAARREPAGRGVGARLTLRLASRPIWLIAFGGELIGFALEAYAFSVAPATLVAPLMACDMVVFVLVATWIFHERLSARGVAGIATMSLGVALLAVGFGGQGELGDPASNTEMLWFLVGCVLWAGVTAGAGTRALMADRRVAAAAFFSAAAGVSYGLGTVATRQVGRTFSADSPWHLLATATPYTLAVCSLLGISLTQRGLQTSALLTFPVTSAVSALLPVVIGSTLLSDEVPGGAGRAAFVIALLLLAGGVVLLGQDRAAAEARAAQQAVEA
jgi:drug/metabolite transporter (DMT)-like permease